MCLLTVSSIGLLIYCLADVDQTHTGFMRIPVERLDQLDFVGRAALTGEGEHASNNANSGFWASWSTFSTVTLVKKSGKNRDRSRRASMPVASGGATAANGMEEKGRSFSLLPGTPNRSRSEGSSGRAAAIITARSWSTNLKGSKSGAAVSMEGPDKHSSQSSPVSLFAELDKPDYRLPEEPKIRTVKYVKRNSILLAKDVFSSLSKGELDIAAMA